MKMEGDDAHLAEKKLLLQLKRPHYDAIKSRRKLWEARPLFDGAGLQIACMEVYEVHYGFA